MDDDVDSGKSVVECLLDAVGGGVALRRPRPRGDADDDVGEVLAARAAHSEPPQLDRRVERRDRARAILLVLR